MNLTAAKRQVLLAFQSFVEHYMIWSSGVHATLGGQGLEAELWEQDGIPGENGILIERRRTLSKSLIRRTPYRYVDRLSGLVDRLIAIKGAEAHIDALHLDFCGTASGHHSEIADLIPFVLASSGRCLAITIADARRNRALETASTVMLRSHELLSDTTDIFWNELLHQQEILPHNPNLPEFFKPADPAKGALRELALFVDVMNLLNPNEKNSFIYPDKIERYIYISRASGHAFRMRSYFFHLTQMPHINPVGLNDNSSRIKQTAATIWLRSKLIYIDYDGNRTRIPIALNDEEENGMYDTLTKLVNLVGGPAATEFQALLTQARRTAEAEKKLQTMKRNVAAQLGLTETLHNEPIVRRKKKKKLTRSTQDTLETRINVQVSLLEAAAKSIKTEGDELDKAYTKAYRLLGITRRRNKTRTVGALYARTQGNFRGNFIGRVLTSLEEKDRTAMLKRLARWYSIIEEKAVTADKLAAEARKAS